MRFSILARPKKHCKVWAPHTFSSCPYMCSSRVSCKEPRLDSCKMNNNSLAFDLTPYLYSGNKQSHTIPILAILKSVIFEYFRTYIEKWVSHSNLMCKHI